VGILDARQWIATIRSMAYKEYSTSRRDVDGIAKIAKIEEFKVANIKLQ